MAGYARSKTSYAIDGGVYLFMSVSSWMLLKDAFCDITSISGQSMAPTLSPAFGSTGATDAVLWWKFLPTHNLLRGDVVLFSTPHRPESMATKRVIALGGDTVQLDPKRRPADSQNGRASEAGKRWDLMYAQNGGRVQVPQGHVWVEGDNWRMTHDSNAYGPISRSLITGKAMSIARPLRHLGQTPWKESWKSQSRVIPGEQPEVINSDVLSWEPTGMINGGCG